MNESNARAYRDSLKKVIFGTVVFPYHYLPDTIITNVSSLDLYAGSPYAPITYPLGNLDSIDKIIITIDENPVNFPAKPAAYLFHPHNSNGKLFIYHSGHCVGIAPAEDIFSNNDGVEPGLVIPRLIQLGYTVLSVPMIHYQAEPINGVGCGYNRHDDLFVDSLYAYPLGFFFKPVIASLNLLGRSNFSSIYMTGLSGGGWVTSVYPAIDSSVTQSFPVAGSWPMPVRQLFYNGGDYEQTFPPLYSAMLDYHEIYTLACLAPARKMLQINNRYDDCCFSGSVAHLYYVDSVQQALAGSGGVFKFYLDETGTRHAITARALDVIQAFIAGEVGSLINLPADSATNLSAYSFNILSNFTVVGTPDVSPLQFSLLKAPAWLALNNTNGIVSGILPVDDIFSSHDTISIKAEDISGRFVIYNYKLTRKRSAPIFFTDLRDNKTLWFILPYSYSLQAVDQLAASLFFFSNPAITITGISIENGSLIKINTNIALVDTDKIGYASAGSAAAISYNNGRKLEDFGFTKIKISAVTQSAAVAGMIRFNTESRKFEYFNGAQWMDMH